MAGCTSEVFVWGNATPCVHRACAVLICEVLGHGLIRLLSG